MDAFPRTKSTNTNTNFLQMQPIVPVQFLVHIAPDKLKVGEVIGLKSAQQTQAASTSSSSS